ncbi:probable secreted beta-glucosidase adg3 [Homarus americanus]|nr:probable secreted beta-glucosidase adg3 [Homarus americanus]
MVSWTSLALLSALAVSALSLPRPDESAYKIPQVGTGRRSQYYVLHDDGTYKYGFDTGEGAFESAKLKYAGRLDGEFGYRDPDGNNIRVQYEAGEGGFNPRGDHLPATHPDFDAAHAAARSRPPFVDSLANTNTDASYGFQFSEDGLSRSEQSDSDGNVRGSYTYTDEEGRTRSYSYTAGRGIGFVVEGDDLPQAADAPGSTPAATRLSSGAGRFSSQSYGTAGIAAVRTTPTFGVPTVRARPATSSVSSTSRFGSGSIGSHTSSILRTPTSSFTAATPRRTGFTRTPTQYSSPSSRPSARPYTGQFEPANTRSQVSPDGGYAFAYETSSHSQAESGDRDNNVAGNFEFVAEDDGQRRAIKYEAGSRTGFIAEGPHIPVGPEVPGAPSGQPTGRIVPVQEVPFVDPLADSIADASYNFAFDSEQYSRSESADADGNVRGTYTVVDDDGTRRTYQFQAGEGIGFETEEVSTSRGPPPSRPTSASIGSTSFTSAGSAASTTQGTASLGFQTYSGTSVRRPSSQSSTLHRPSVSSTVKPSSSFSSPPATGARVRSTFTPTSTREVFPGFQLRQYGVSDNPEKFGYVLTFDK